MNCIFFDQVCIPPILCQVQFFSNCAMLRPYVQAREGPPSWISNFKVLSHQKPLLYHRSCYHFFLLKVAFKRTHWKINAYMKKIYYYIRKFQIFLMVDLGFKCRYYFQNVCLYCYVFVSCDFSDSWDALQQSYIYHRGKLFQNV